MEIRPSGKLYDEDEGIEQMQESQQVSNQEDAKASNYDTVETAEKKEEKLE